MQEPFAENEILVFEMEYRISRLLTEVETFWIYDAIQTATQKVVMIKVYKNDAFSSPEELEKAWDEEIKSLEVQEAVEGSTLDFIESSIKETETGKYFIIVVAQTIKDSLPKMESERPRLFGRGKRKQTKSKPASPKPSKEVWEFKRPPTPTKPSKPSTGAGPIDDKMEKRTKVDEEDLSTIDSSEGAISKGSEIPKDEREVHTAEPTEKQTEETEELIEEDSREAIGSTEGSQPDESIMTTERKEVRDTPTDRKVGMTPEKEHTKQGSSGDTSEKLKERVSAGKSQERKDYHKHLSMHYYDRMNPENYYPLRINIADIEQEKVATIVNPVTGERRVQEKDKLHTKLVDPKVTIRPIIPGCTVDPREIETDFSKKEDEVIFYVTPGVKGKVIGEILFLNEGKIIHTTGLKAKVVDPTHARAIAIYGILAGFIPKILTWLGINWFIDQTVNELSEATYQVIGNMDIGSFIGLGAIIPVGIASYVVYRRLRPKTSRVQFKILDFRFK